MESNSDKEMRDKLRGIELPFDPKAWEQMDAMLQKDRKPKAFIWWWTGGIAAALIIAAGLFGYNQLANRNAAVTTLTTKIEKQNSTAVNTAVTQPVTNNLSNNTNTVFKEKENAPAASNQVKANVETVHKTNSYPVTLIAEKLEKKPVEKIIAPVKTNNRVATPVAKNSIAATHLKGAKKHSNSLADNLNAGGQQQANKVGSTTGIAESHALNTTNNYEASLLEPVAASIVQPATAADFMLKMNVNALTANADQTDNDMKKKDSEDVDLKKLKKKIPFIYSLGVAANVTGTTLGNQGSKNIFDKKPSYMVGITQDFMFLKRIALTTGLMFSQTSFTVPDFNYKCNITELNIPIGVKAYLVSKSKVRFYIDAGIINHIKLQETFAPINVIYANNLQVGSFPATLSPAGGFANSFSSYDQSTTGSYSINKGKRYYASFYTGAGAEYIAKNHLVFFAEPLFYMSLEKITVPDKHKYNLGLSGGFRYQF